MRKKQFAVLVCTSAIVGSPVTHVQAIELEEPYILTQQLIQEPVTKSDCQQLIIAGYATGNAEREEYIANLEQTIQAINDQYEEYTQKIQQLQSDQPQSIEETAQIIDELVDDLFAEYELEYEDFDEWTEEEIEALLLQDDTYVEWVSYLQSLQAEVNQYIAYCQELENEHADYLYQLEAARNDDLLDHESREQLDQCLLYSYSTPHLAIEDVLLNEQVASLSEWIVQLDKYLHEIVPSAYSKLSFDDIYQAFNAQPSLEQTQQFLSGKQRIELDAQGMELYSYRQEFTLLDLQILANLAYQNYYQTEDFQYLMNQYYEVLNLKESQWEYFYSLNSEVFNYLAHLTVEFLNNSQYTDTKSQESIAQLQQKYQLKLVQFDESQQIWQAVTHLGSIYYDEYFDYELFTEGEIEEEHLPGQEFESILPEEAPISGRSKKLAELKGHLNESNKPKVKELPELPKNKSNTKNKSGKKSSDSKDDKDKKKPMKLPNAGEVRFWFYLASGLLAAGCGLILWRIRTRRKEREKINRTKLD